MSEKAHNCQERRGEGKVGDELHRRKNEHEQNNLMDYWKINKKKNGQDDTSEKGRQI